MNWPNWMQDNVWQWLAGIAIGVIGIIVSVLLALRQKHPANINQTLNINGSNNNPVQINKSTNTTVNIKNIDPEESVKLDAILQNTEKLLKEKGYEATRQLLDDLREKHQKVVSELNEYKTKDKRAEEALIAFRDGKSEKAKDLFVILRKEEMEKEVEHAKTAYNLGNVYFVELNFPKALEAYLDAVRLSPDDSIYLNEAGKAYCTSAQYDKAIEYLEKALQSDLKTFGEGHPNVATCWNNLGGVWKAKGEYDKAIEYLEKALQSDLKTFGCSSPNVATRWNNLGEAWQAKGEYDKAIGYYEKALKSFNKAGLNHRAKEVEKNLKIIRGR